MYFVATFFDIINKEEMVSTFSFNDLAYDGDIGHIEEGAGFVLVIGITRKCFNDNGKLTYGGKDNFRRIYLRHTQELNPREKVLIDEDVESWTKLFNK